MLPLPNVYSSHSLRIGLGEEVSPAQAWRYRVVMQQLVWASKICMHLDIFVDWSVIVPYLPFSCTTDAGFLPSLTVWLDLLVLCSFLFLAKALSASEDELLVRASGKAAPPPYKQWFRLPASYWDSHLLWLFLFLARGILYGKLICKIKGFGTWSCHVSP